VSAETLRRAAVLMRARAEAATGATHRWDNIPAGAGVSRVFCGQVLIAKTDERIGQDDHNAQHIASWHPAVALAVADLLEAVTETGVSDALFRQWLDHDRSGQAALAVARAYLGESR
jgi:hypothetical protein